MPGYSPEFNAIEALWSVIKRRVKAKLALRKFVNLVEEDFKKLVLDVLDNVTSEEGQRAAALNNRHYLHRTIGDIMTKLAQDKQDMMILEEVNLNAVQGNSDDQISNHDSVGKSDDVQSIKQDDQLINVIAEDEEIENDEIPDLSVILRVDPVIGSHNISFNDHAQTIDDPIERMLVPNTWIPGKPI